MNQQNTQLAGERTQENNTPESFPVDIKAAKFGAWTLGYADVNVTIHKVRVPALALYVKKGEKVHRTVTLPQIKFAVAWLEACKVPARIAAKLLVAIFDAKGGR